MRHLFLAALTVTTFVGACHHGPPREPSAIYPQLRSSDVGDRIEAAEALREDRTAPPEAIPYLLAALDSETSPRVYGELLVTLATTGNPAAQPYIEGALQHPNEDIHEHAEEAFKMLRLRNPNLAPLPVGAAVLPRMVKIKPSRAMPDWNVARVDGEVPECWKDGTGKKICGFNCLVDDDQVACASTPYGHCSREGGVHCYDGPTLTVVGVGVGSPKSYPALGPAPECKLGSDGRNACGYNCQVGSNGKAYCSSVANGKCALNSDGTFTCP